MIDEPINRFDVRRPKSLHYTQRPEFVPVSMQPYGKPRELEYWVATKRGRLPIRPYPNAWAALANGHELRLRGLWWVECEVGGQNVNKDPENVNDQNIPTA